MSEKNSGGVDITELIGLTSIGKIEIEVIKDWDFQSSQDINFRFKNKKTGERYFSKYQEHYPGNQPAMGFVGRRSGCVNIYKSTDDTYKLHINY